MDEVAQYAIEYSHSFIGHLGIIFQSSEPGFVLASMPVDYRTCQPFGYLSGGASLALAESMAGHGSRLLCKDGQYPYGVQVSGNHLIAVPEGGFVHGNGKIIHHGQTIHVWNIDILNQENVTVSTVRIVNYIMLKNKK